MRCALLTLLFLSINSAAIDDETGEPDWRKSLVEFYPADLKRCEQKIDENEWSQGKL